MPFARRIGYIGWLGHGNLGDEAMYAAFKKLFGSFNVIPYKNTKKIEYYEDILHRKAFEAVFLGGGTFINTVMIKQLKIAQEKYKDIFVFGSGAVDPVLYGAAELSREFLSGTSEWTEFLHKCRYVSVRGPISKKILEKNGFPGAEIIGDPVLSLALDRVKQRGRKKILGINVGIAGGNLFGSESEVLDITVEFAKIMSDKGWKIIFYPVIKSDIPYIEEAARRVGRHLVVFDKYGSLDKTIKSMEKCDIFIGEKLHSTALAMCAYTPSIMLGYRSKCLDFMSSMGLERFHMRTDELSLDLLISLAEELYKNQERFQGEIFKVTSIYKATQKEKAAMISDMICQK